MFLLSLRDNLFLGFVDMILVTYMPQWAEKEFDKKSKPIDETLQGEDTLKGGSECFEILANGK